MQIPSHWGLLQDHRQQLPCWGLHCLRHCPWCCHCYLGLSGGGVHGCAHNRWVEVHCREVWGAVEFPSLLRSIGWQACGHQSPCSLRIPVLQLQGNFLYCSLGSCRCGILFLSVKRTKKEKEKWAWIIPCNDCHPSEPIDLIVQIKHNWVIIIICLMQKFMNLKFYFIFGMGWQSLEGRKYPFKKMFVLRERRWRRWRRWSWWGRSPQNLKEALCYFLFPAPSWGDKY